MAYGKPDFLDTVGHIYFGVPNADGRLSGTKYSTFHAGAQVIGDGGLVGIADKDGKALVPAMHRAGRSVSHGTRLSG